MTSFVISFLTSQDNCPWVANRNQCDFDKDGLDNLCDNCPSVKNPSQEDFDDDGEGDKMVMVMVRMMFVIYLCY